MSIERRITTYENRVFTPNYLIHLLKAIATNPKELKIIYFGDPLPKEQIELIRNLYPHNFQLIVSIVANQQVFEIINMLSEPKVIKISDFETLCSEIDKIGYAKIRIEYYGPEFGIEDLKFIPNDIEFTFKKEDGVEVLLVQRKMDYN